MEETQESTDKKSKFNPIIIIVALILVVAGGYFYLTGNTTNQAGQTQTTETTFADASDDGDKTAETDEDAMEGGDKMENGDAMVQPFEVEGGAFFLDPNEIRVKQGETVTIKFTNVGGSHDFVLDEFDVQSTLTQTGDTVEVEFIASEAGEFEFYCSVGNHRSQGMVGNLIVE